MQPIAPFKLAPYFQTRIWGFNDLAPWFDYKTDGEPVGEVWLTGAKATVATGPMAGQSFADVVAEHADAILGDAHAPVEGRAEFPLLLKVLFPKEKLSVQVHPDDALAQKIGEPRGKTECWYALEAEPGAKVALGLKPGVGEAEVRAAIEAKNLEELLGEVAIAAGDMVYVDAGTVHAIWPGAVIFETQQTSDVTYRLYDYGRPRELHIEESFKAMKVDTDAGKVTPVKENGKTVLIDKRYFRIERWKLDGAAVAEKLADGCQVVSADGESSAALLFMSQGAVKIAGDGFEAFTLNRCEVAVLPAHTTGWQIEPVDSAEVLRILPQ